MKLRPIILAAAPFAAACAPAAPGAYSNLRVGVPLDEMLRVPARWREARQP